MKLAFNYYAFGLNISSDIPIIGFQLMEFEKPEVFVYENIVPGSLDLILNNHKLYESNDREFLLKLKNIGKYLVQDGNKITVQKAGKASYADVSAFLISTAFGVLLHQRGFLALHASAIFIKEKSIVFVGPSGIGKTTLALNFIKSGAKLLTDDIAAIDLRSNNPAINPSFSYLKIWQDSLHYFGHETRDLLHIKKGIKKFYLPVEAFEPSNVPIHTIFILKKHPKNYNEVIELKGAEKFQRIKENVFFYRGIRNTNLEKRNFELVMQLIQMIPVKLLLRNDKTFDLEALQKEIEKNIFT